MPLELILGCMFSGKTTELRRLSSLHRAIGRRVLLATSALDTRDKRKAAETTIKSIEDIDFARYDVVASAVPRRPRARAAFGIDALHRRRPKRELSTPALRQFAAAHVARRRRCVLQGAVRGMPRRDARDVLEARGGVEGADRRRRPLPTGLPQVLLMDYIRPCAFRYI